MNLETENPMSTQQASNSSITELKRTAELEELLIDAEADDEQVQQTHPILQRPWLLLLGLILVALNLRPALSSMAPMLSEISKTLGLSAAQAGLLTTLPVLCLGLFAPLAPVLARRFWGRASGVGDSSDAGRRDHFAQFVRRDRPVRWQRAGRRQHRGDRCPAARHCQTRLPETGRHHDRRLHHGPVPGRGHGGWGDRAVERTFRQKAGPWASVSGCFQRWSRRFSGCRKLARSTARIMLPIGSEGCCVIRWPGK